MWRHPHPALLHTPSHPHQHLQITFIVRLRHCLRNVVRFLVFMLAFLYLKPQCHASAAPLTGDDLVGHSLQQSSSILGMRLYCW